MICISLSLVGSLLGNSLVAVGESDKPAKINLVHTTISLCSNLLLIPPLGIFGAAITRMIGPTVTNPLNYIFLNRKFTIHVLSAYLKPMLIFIAWFIPALLIPDEALLLKIMMLIGFIFINYVFSVITKDDFAFIQSEANKLIKHLFIRRVELRNKL
jgi:O-antigen/teichoic acid export membrane protein